MLSRFAFLFLIFAAILTPPAIADALRVRVETEPAAATLFLTGKSSQHTPCEFSVDPARPTEIRLVRRGYHDEEFTLDEASFAALPQRDGIAVLNITLKSTNETRLIVTADPPEAELYVDGRRCGVTPMTVDGLAPGPHSIRLTEADCATLARDITLAAGATEKVHLVLQDKVAPMYLEMIAKNPKRMGPRIDLVHYYVLKGKYNEATALLTECGKLAAANPRAPDVMRMYEEMSNIYEFRFAPNRDNQTELRQLCKKLMQEGLSLNVERPDGIKHYFFRHMPIMDQTGHPPGWEPEDDR